MPQRNADNHPSDRGHERYQNSTRRCSWIVLGLEVELNFPKDAVFILVPNPPQMWRLKILKASAPNSNRIFSRIGKVFRSEMFSLRLGQPRTFGSVFVFPTVKDAGVEKALALR